MRARSHTTSTLLFLSSVLTAPCAMAQSAPPAFDGPVIVSGFAPGRAALELFAGETANMNPERSSSCSFMAPYDPRLDAVTLAYRREFAVRSGVIGDDTPINVSAPFGDVSTVRDAASVSGRGGAGFHSTMSGRGLGGCSASDLREAAARAHIAAHDRSLAQGLEAYAHHDYARALEQFSTAWRKVGYGGLPALMVANLYLNGLGTQRDTGAAIKWLEDVATLPFRPGWEMRFDPAQPQAMTVRVQAAMTLATIYDRGIGVPVDRKQADKWYAQAAEFGFVPALDTLGQKGLSAAAGSGAQARALDALKRAADAGYAPAQYHLARVYYEGNGVPRDLKLAGAYFNAAAHAGLPAALFAAGHMADQGEGVPADSKKAIVYYKDAALKGDRDAQFALATYFYNGEVVRQDVTTARKWFAAAARQGQADAMFDLGTMSAKGEGGARDPAVAYVWLTLAQQAGQARAGAALAELAPTLSAEERKRAESVLHPAVALR